ncbi:hypothetical protein M758_11G127400 [Ceratodon purpureus]|nr:hypothetical protein M758_11G127400 [Ceratodon purpureus]
MSNHDSNPSQLRTLHVNSHGRCVQILRITSIELHFEEVIAHIHGRRRFKKPPDNGFSNTKPELKNLNPTERHYNKPNTSAPLKQFVKSELVAKTSSESE